MGGLDRSDSIPHMMPSPRAGSPRRMGVLAVAAALLVAACLVFPAPAAASDGAGSGSLPGAEEYAFHCSTCHGQTGGGLTESRARFPADHQYCVRCHNPRNRPVMSFEEMARDQTAFSLGDPTPLADPAYLQSFPDAAVLAAYVQAAMPRWDPGKLTEEQARRITLFALHLSGSLTGPLAEAYYGHHDIAGLDLAGYAPWR